VKKDRIIEAEKKKVKDAENFIKFLQA